MNAEELWQRYARTWTLDGAERTPELLACVDEDCVYCDVNGVVEGRERLAAYMEGFKRSAPGASFRILRVAEHHARCLSDWALHAADGRVLQTGRSFAERSGDGRLRHITGFFDPQPGNSPEGRAAG